MAVSDVLFPFYEILVENIFGSYGLAILGLAVVLLLILLVCRSSTNIIMYWMIFYFMVMGTLYLGAIGLILAFIIYGSYFMISIIRMIFREV